MGPVLRSGRPVRGVLVAAIVAVVGLTTFSGVASARAVLWGGTAFSTGAIVTPVPQTILLSVSGGRVTLKHFQAVMSCIDTGDGTESERAFDGSTNIRATLHRNRFTLEFTETSGGRTGDVRLSGMLGSNGRGTVRLRLSATGVDSETSAVVERCSTSFTYGMHRGR